MAMYPMWFHEIFCIHHTFLSNPRIAVIEITYSIGVSSKKLADDGKSLMAT